MLDVVELAAFADYPGEIGPKLRGLTALAGWGYRVPDGFALTRAAISALAEGGASAPLPEPVVAAYEALCARLGRASPGLAVRSAAVAEDGDRRSFAGIFESVLGVRGPAQLRAAIHACVASGRSARAEAYGGDGSCDEMSVGVQELVDARAAGVVFSRHPVTHRSDRLVIEAVLGLGSTMIEGTARPDHVEIGRADRRVLRYELGDKQRRAIPAEAGGVTVEETPAAERWAPCLATDEVEQLCSAAIDIETRSGFAVNVEWIITGDGELVIVQFRPITSGPREARAPVRWDPVRYARQRGGRRVY